MVMDFEDWEPDYDLCMREDWPGLVRYRERVARRAPDNLYAQGRLGEAYVLNGEYERAIEFLSKLYHEHPYYTDAEHYLLGGAGVLAMFLALFASAPSAAVGRKVVGEERRGMSLQKMIEQANLPVAAGEFLRIGALLAVATAVVGYVLLRTATGAILGAMIGPLAYWGYLGSKRDKTRRSYQEALARVATILRDVIGRGGSLNEGIIAVALRGPTVVREDFEEVRTLLGTGRTPEEALEPMGERRRDPVLTMLVEILLVHREHGSGVKAVLDRLAAAARRRANVRKRILAEQAQLRWEARIVSIAPFIMLAIFRFSAPGLVAPYCATTSGEITVLAGLISIVSYVLVMRVGNRPLQIVESAFVTSEPGTGGNQPASRPQPKPHSGLAGEGRTA